VVDIRSGHLEDRHHRTGAERSVIWSFGGGFALVPKTTIARATTQMFDLAGALAGTRHRWPMTLSRRRIPATAGWVE